MTQYVQYRFSNSVHIVRDTMPSGMYRTQCGKWYHPNQSRLRGLEGHREQDLVCSECRSRAAAQSGKKLYRSPILRRGLSEAKRAKLRKAQQAHTERQRLAAWNAAAQAALQERTP
jgi:hypothetical protein